MKILLVNNHTLHLNKLKVALAGHQVETVVYQPGVKFNQSGQDLVVLTGGGGEGMEANDYHTSGDLWYKDEIELILSTQLPVIGICMGFQLMSVAYGQPVKQMPKGVKQIMTLNSTRTGQSLVPERLNQFDFHDWHVTSAHKDFEVLADSGLGLEMIKHKYRRLIGTQFHPEIPGGTLTLQNLLTSV